MTTRVNHPKDEMSLILDERRLEIQAVERLPGMQPGDAIVCTCGILWVTQEGDPEDYVLQKGSAFVAKRQGVVVVQALTKATYRLSSNDKPRVGEAFRMPARAPRRLAGLNAPSRLLEAAFGDWRQKGITAAPAITTALPGVNKLAGRLYDLEKKNEHHSSLDDFGDRDDP